MPVIGPGGRRLGADAALARRDARHPRLPPVTPAQSATIAVQRLQDWAAAWMSHDVDQYMGFYGPDFKPLKGTKAAWIADRHRLVGKPGAITVTLTQRADACADRHARRDQLRPGLHVGQLQGHDAQDARVGSRGQRMEDRRRKQSNL